MRFSVKVLQISPIICIFVVRKLTIQISKNMKITIITFTVYKNTGMELGHRLSAMGYKYHKLNSGAAYRMIEKAP